jgi:D-3-phosphoglycerate dehydrogenase / 2-oxoglutarate reductase
MECNAMHKKPDYRVFITGSGIATEAQHLLERERCAVEIGHPDDTSQDIAKKLAAFNPDALIVRQGKITRDVVRSANNLKVICKHGVGTDNIDIEAATLSGIPVFYTPNANFEAVATHTMALILALMRQVPAQDKLMRDGVFDKSSYRGQELSGKTLGLIGFGRVGRRLSLLAAPFGIKVVVYHPSKTNEVLPGYLSKTEIVEEVYKQADIISLHCPLTSDTRDLVDSDAFKIMKEGVYIINTARGGIINEPDLLAALKSGKIGGAALDVFEVEPPSANNNPLFNQANIILSPHIAGTSDNSLRNMGFEAAGHILSVLKEGSVDTSAIKNSEVLEKLC